MKALTICQPYADMIARGEKVIENRTWPTTYRGQLAIHAGKSRAWMDPEDRKERPQMAFGAVVAVATLIDCLPVEKLPAHLAQRADANGPWCWVLSAVLPVIPPEAVRGAQGLWDWTPGHLQEPPRCGDYKPRPMEAGDP